MYVIFPLDELLDLNSARKNKRGRVPIDQPSHTRVTAEEVLPLSQPNQLLPNQLKPPLNKQQPKTTNPTQPTPTKQSKAPPTPPQKQPPTTPPTQKQPPTTPTQKQPPTTPTQKQPPTSPTQKQPIPQPKSTLSKASSKTSIAVTPPSIVVPSHTPPPPASVIDNTQALTVRKPSVQLQTPVVIIPQLPDQVTKRQRSSHSTSTETSSTSSTGAKGKALLSPQPSGGPATNRSSWGGTPAVAPFQESYPARSGSFKAFKDSSVSTDGKTLKAAELNKAESVQDIASGSSPRSRPPLKKHNSFRSHLSDSCALRPRPSGTELLKKPPPPSKQPSPTSEIPKKTPEIIEQQPSSTKVNPAQGLKTADAATAVQAPKERQPSVTEGIRIKQEVPLQASPPITVGAVVSQKKHHQLTAAQSLRIQQECLPPVSQDSKGTNQRHPSGKSSNRGSGSQRLSDLPPFGGTRGATVGSGSANPKTEGVVPGSPRGLQKPHKNMASHEASFRDLTNPTHNESLKAHNAFTFKLVKTGPSSGTLEESQSPDETTSSHHHHHHHHHQSGPGPVIGATPGHHLHPQHPTS